MVTKHKKYSNDKITILWKPEICIHSTNCVKNLPGVFNSNERPWIKIENADSGALMKAIDTCPSAALSYIQNDGHSEEATNSVKVEILKDGPLIISGDIVIKQGDKETVVKKRAALCRCGASKNKPFCDGVHKEVGFVG